ncbi:hypothetical protein GGI21_006220 [Coemansia aciculifera]|nr:hypothetical protein GGI21_006220 [Coemansia aciculifera]
MDLSGLDSISVEDAAELAETYSKIASIYSRIANPSATSTRQTPVSSAPPASTVKSGASLSAYMLFAADQRDIIRSANPSLTSEEQIGVISAAWNAASSDLRERYIGLIERSSKIEGGGSAESVAEPKKRAKDGEAAAKKKESRKTKSAANGAEASK